MAEESTDAVGQDDRLEPFEEDVGRVLAIVAHPDDLEYGAAAAVAAWTRAGHEVAYLLATRGEAGIDGLSPEDCAPLRVDEQIRSAAVVGVHDVEFLDHADGVLEYGVELRRDFAAAIRRHRPDTVLTINHRDHWGAPGTRNSADHRAVGEAVLDAVADAGNRWIFPMAGAEDADGASRPAHKAARVMVAGSPLSRHAVDVSGTVDLAVASLSEHRTYLDGLGDHAMADPEFLRWMLSSTGARIGTDAAVGFELFAL